MDFNYATMRKIIVNDYAVVLTKDDGQSWHLKKSDIIRFNLMDCREELGVEEISVGLMKNDILYKIYELDQNQRECEISITENGAYSFCIMDEGDE